MVEFDIWGYEIEISYGALILYCMFFVALWIVAPTLDFKSGLSLIEKIIATIVMIPLTILVANAVGNR